MKITVLTILIFAASSFSTDSTFVLELRKKMEAGDVNAQIELGRIYHLGKKTRRDLLMAFKLIKPLAEAGNTKAEYELGSLFDQRESYVFPDLLSLRYKETVDSLGKLYYLSESAKNQIHSKLQMEQNPEKWYRKAADKGLVEASRLWDFFTILAGLEIPERLKKIQLSGLKRQRNKMTECPNLLLATLIL